VKYYTIKKTWVTTTSFMEFIGAQNKHVLSVDKCANHLQDILFPRNTNFFVLSTQHTCMMPSMRTESG